MKDIRNYIDATYLKTAHQAGLDALKNEAVVFDVIQDAIENNYKCLMIRPEYVSFAKEILNQHKSKVLLGTVIDFPLGKASVEDKISEASMAINNGADELDFVINYNAFKVGNLDLVSNEILQCTKLCIDNNKTIKWIIEVGALSNNEIVRLTSLVKQIVVRNFKEIHYQQVFVKSSTGYYIDNEGKSIGASPKAITLMLENATPLLVKASGGIKTRDEALFYIQLGVQRIGTSNQKQFISNKHS